MNKDMQYIPVFFGLNCAGVVDHHLFQERAENNYIEFTVMMDKDPMKFILTDSTYLVSYVYQPWEVPILSIDATSRLINQSMYKDVVHIVKKIDEMLSKGESTIIF